MLLKREREILGKTQGDEAVMLELMSAGISGLGLGVKRSTLIKGGFCNIVLFKKNFVLHSMMIVSVVEYGIILV